MKKNIASSSSSQTSNETENLFRTMWYCHLIRLYEFYAHYNPPAMKECYAQLKQYKGREEEMFESLQRMYGPEPANLGILEKIMTRGDANGPRELEVKEKIIFQALLLCIEQAKESHTHRNNVEKQIIALLAENGIPSKEISEKLMNLYDKDEKEFFFNLYQLLGRKPNQSSSSSLSPLPPPTPLLYLCGLDISSNTDIIVDKLIEVETKKGKKLNSFTNRLRMSNSSLSTVSNFDEWLETPLIKSSSERTSTTPAFKTIPDSSSLFPSRCIEINSTKQLTNSPRRSDKKLKVSFSPELLFKSSDGDKERK